MVTKQGGMRGGEWVKGGGARFFRIPTTRQSGFVLSYPFSCRLSSD